MIVDGLSGGNLPEFTGLELRLAFLVIRVRFSEKGRDPVSPDSLGSSGARWDFPPYHPISPTSDTRTLLMTEFLDISRCFHPFVSGCDGIGSPSPVQP
jgi:hypothetical protein